MNRLPGGVRAWGRKTPGYSIVANVRSGSEAEVSIRASLTSAFGGIADVKNK